MSLNGRIAKAERLVADIQEAEANPRFEFFGVNFWSLDCSEESYYWISAPKYYEMNYGSNKLDELQAEGAIVVLLFDRRNYDFPFKLVMGPDNRLRIKIPDYDTDEHGFLWEGYTPGTCLAKAREIHGWKDPNERNS